jgi:hypothetical protein
MAAEANWYDLKRATPTFEPPQKDRWSTLATNPREALQYFERDCSPHVDWRYAKPTKPMNLY